MTETGRQTEEANEAPFWIREMWNCNRLPDMWPSHLRSSNSSGCRHRKCTHTQCMFHAGITAWQKSLLTSTNHVTRCAHTHTNACSCRIDVITHRPLTCSKLTLLHGNVYSRATRQMHTFTNDSQSPSPFLGLICFRSALICLIKTLWRGNDSLEGCNFRNTAGWDEASPGDSCSVLSGHYGSSSHLALVWPGGPVSQS